MPLGTFLIILMQHDGFAKECAYIADDGDKRPRKKKVEYFNARQCTALLYQQIIIK